MRRMIIGALAAAIAAAAAPATATETADPLEALNRAAFDLNAALLDHVVAPLAARWEAVAPAPARAAVANVFANLREPLTAAFSVVQGDVANARAALARFAVNSTVGLLGVHDPAAAIGLHSRPEDLGQVLCAAGAPEGPFLVLPLYGPGTLRDVAADALTLGAGLSLAGDGALAVAAGDRIAAALEAGDELAGLQADALDAYAAQRSAHVQARRAACSDPAAPDRRMALSPWPDGP